MVSCETNLVGGDHVAIRALVCLVLATTAGCMEPRSHRVRLEQGDCASCHLDDYYRAGTTGDGGVDGGPGCSLSHTVPYRFPTQCELCHVETAWCDVPIGRVVENHRPSFDLAGGHETTSVTEPTVLAQCVRCHTAPPTAPDQPNWETLSTDCATCHEADRQAASARYCAAANPGGGHGSFTALRCEDCHRGNSWWPAVPGLHVEGRMSSRHGGKGCQGCHDLDLLALQQPNGGVLGECLADGGIVPPAPRYEFTVCGTRNDCPECNCVQCHSVSHNRESHEGSVRVDYDTCAATIPADRAALVPSARESMCWSCHPSGSEF